MKFNRILFIDTETGGIDPINNSLLSIAFVIWDNGKISQPQEFLINDGVLNVTQSALDINKIDLIEHSKKAMSPKDIIYKIEQYLECNFSDEEKIILCGHNVLFDINFFKNFCQNYGLDYNKRFSHRYVDTASILFYLSTVGIIPDNMTSSQNAFDYFNISVNNRHSALGDVLATTELFNQMLLLISNLKDTKTFKTY